MGNSNKRRHLLLLYKDIIENLPFIDEKGEKKELVNTFINLRITYGVTKNTFGVI